MIIFFEDRLYLTLDQKTTALQPDSESGHPGICIATNKQFKKVGDNSIGQMAPATYRTTLVFQTKESLQEMIDQLTLLKEQF